MSDCIFCKIVNKEIPAKIVLETETILAFEDLNPVAPTHLLFIPKIHIESLDKLTEKESGIIGNLLFEISNFANKNQLSKEGYRIVNNMGKQGGQTVYHIHFHLLAGRQMEWPPG
jgi:histidine triad (HIT) family protein